MTVGADYPRSLAEVISDVNYKPETLRSLEAFKTSNPWKGIIPARMEKFQRLHEDLCSIYNVDVQICFDPSIMLNESSGRSNYNPIDNMITLHGKLSVLTFLHEWGHVLKGRSEHKACRWSVNLFRKIFPDNFERLYSNANGHFLGA